VNRSSQNSFDSGYATASNRASSATTFSFDASPSVRRQSDQSLLRLSIQKRRSSNAHSSYSPRQSQHSENEILDNIPADSSGHRDKITSQYTADDNSSDFYIPHLPSLAEEPARPSSEEDANHEHYRPPHAHPSRCSRAGVVSEFPDLGLETCQRCGATKLHHLASISRRTDIALYKEVVRSNLSSINEIDSEGNLCLHFAAGAGATLEQLTILQRAGAHLTHPNYFGETVLHILDPKDYGRKLPAVLSWATQAGLTFCQRDCLGKTPFHHILGRTTTLTNVHDLMPFLEAAGRSMTFLDRDGNTPLDLLRENWLKANHGVHLPQLEAMLIAYNIPLAFRKVSDSWSKLPAPPNDVNKLAVTSCDENTTDILDIVNRSQQEAFCQNGSHQNVLHALAAFSFHANYQISCYLTPCGLLECLQHRLENSANVGVDVNQYSNDGLTPLHCFLTATFDISLDIPWLVPECVELLLRFGADPRLRDRNGNTALHLACSRGRFECAGKIISHLSSHCEKQEYVRCLTAMNEDGKTIAEHAEASMNSETVEANERRKQCIGLVRVRVCAATGEPVYSYMPALYSSAASISSALGPSAMTWSTQLPNHARKSSSSPARPASAHCKTPSWPARTSSLDMPEAEMRSAFED
jgi:ankyrin repeat protein